VGIPDPKEERKRGRGRGREGKGGGQLEKRGRGRGRGREEERTRKEGRKEGLLETERADAEASKGDWRTGQGQGPRIHKG